jgi:hypothetical protein
MEVGKLPRSITHSRIRHDVPNNASSKPVVQGLPNCRRQKREMKQIPYWAAGTWRGGGGGGGAPTRVSSVEGGETDWAELKF